MRSEGNLPAPIRPVRPSALIIVTHERVPDPHLWPKLLGEVDLLIISDNSVSEGIQSQIRELSRGSPVPCVLLQNGSNLGLARALNASVAAARSRGCESVYFLDHDADIDTDFFRTQRSLLETLERAPEVSVGVVVPIVTDPVPSLPAPSLAHQWTAVRSVITSGILMRVSTFNEVGGFNEALFVEGVDFDFAARLRASGHLLVRINRVMVRQQFGLPLSSAPLSTRAVERVYAAFYYLGVLAGRSNSFHTRLSAYSLSRREASVRSLEDPNSALGSRQILGRMRQQLGLIFALTVDAVASRNRTYLRLMFRTR